MNPPMNLPGSLLGHGGAFFVALGVVSGVHLAVAREGALRGSIERYVALLERHLAFLRMPLRGGQLLVMQAAAFAAAGVLAWALGVWPLALLAVSAVFAPQLWLERRRVARVMATEEQLAAWLVSVAGALRSGNPIAEALVASLETTPAPLSEEVDLTMTEHRLGVPLSDALTALSTRLGSRTVSSAVFVLALARQTGGDVPVTLERAAASLRELARLEGVVRSKTAEGKAQALVISLMPAPLVGIIELTSPGFFAPLTSSASGYAVVAAAGVLWLAAVLLAKRIVAVEV